MSILSKAEIQELGLVEGASEGAYQPNGVDLTVKEVKVFYNPGSLGVDDKDLPDLATAEFHEYDGCPGFGYWDLGKGEYLVEFSETVNLPTNVMGYLHPRSTLLRSGVSLQTAVWDAGYHGKGQSLLVIHNHNGWLLERGARIAQMTFHRLGQETEGYNGSYQGEGLQPYERDILNVLDGYTGTDFSGPGGVSTPLQRIDEEWAVSSGRFNRLDIAYGDGEALSEKDWDFYDNWIAWGFDDAEHGKERYIQYRKNELRLV